MLKRVCLSVVVICLLAYSLAISAIPKENNQIPTPVDQVIANIDRSIYKIITSQAKLGKLIDTLEHYTAEQATNTEGDGTDWAASMLISYEFKQIGVRNLAGVAIIKQMMYLNKDAFPRYLKLNYDLVMRFFTKSTKYSLEVIESNYEYIQNDEIVKKSKEGVKEVEKVNEQFANIFLNFFVGK